jgi:hypothetical protein
MGALSTGMSFSSEIIMLANSPMYTHENRTLQTFAMVEPIPSPNLGNTGCFFSASRMQGICCIGKRFIQHRTIAFPHPTSQNTCNLADVATP